MAQQTAIEGKDVILQARKQAADGSLMYVPVLCGTQVEFNYDTELIEKATVGMGGFRSYRPGLGGWNIRLSMVTHIASSTILNNEYYTVFDTLMESLRKNGLDILLTFRDSLGNVKNITGHVLIPHTGISVSPEGFSEDDIELQGSGAFSISTTLATLPTNENDVKEKNFDPAGGETTYTHADLINRTILYVSRSGIGQRVIESGTPAEGQVLYDAATGKLTFGSPLSPGEWVQILYK